MFRSWYGQILAILILSFTMVAVLLVLIVPQVNQRYQQEVTQSMHGHLAGYVVDHYLLTADSELDLVHAKEVFHDLMILGPNFEFYVIAPNGKILAYSADPNKVVRQALDTQPIKRYLSGQHEHHLILGDDPRNLERKKAFSVAPIIAENGLKGYLYVVLGSEIYDSIAEQVAGSHQIRWGLWIVLLGLGICFLLSALLAKVMAKPLQQLTRSVQAQEQLLDVSPQIESRPLLQPKRGIIFRSRELIQLTQSFNHLLLKMNQQMRELKNIHELRRELVSHISHDLRSPLASLMGYLETWMLQRKRLSDDESKKYIGIAMNNAQKMHCLIEQLFELAYLDSGDVQVQIESFSIAELAQDVLQKFALKAQRKKIVLRVTPKETHIHVMGDIEKLERVLSNLVDNALRHTEEGGTITIRLSSQGHFVAIEVEDTGIGIPQKDIDHIFNAHYKAGNSVRGNVAHGGLGLAITKKLLALHESHIQVRSQCGEGTCFQFVLPAS